MSHWRELKNEDVNERIISVDGYLLGLICLLSTGLLSPWKQPCLSLQKKSNRASMAKRQRYLHREQAF